MNPFSNGSTSFYGSFLNDPPIEIDIIFYAMVIIKMHYTNKSVTVIDESINMVFDISFVILSPVVR